MAFGLPQGLVATDYWKKNGFELTKGDSIEVPGSKTKMNDAEVVLAREVKEGGSWPTFRSFTRIGVVPASPLGESCSLFASPIVTSPTTFHRLAFWFLYFQPDMSLVIGLDVSSAARAKQAANMAIKNERQARLHMAASFGLRET
jgi:hypothetical protein